MTWLIISAILLAAFGPLLWMVPSKSDRRLSRMRSRARALGMQVEVTQLPDLAAQPHAKVTAGGRRLEPMVTCAAYRLASAKVLRNAPQWRLLRAADTDARGPLPGWQWDSAPTGDAPYWSQVEIAVAALPADALACSAQPSEVACWWRERATADTAESSVDSVHSALDGLLEIQRVTDLFYTTNDAADAAEDER